MTKVKNIISLSRFFIMYIKSNNTMATNKPTGDNSRKGAVKERSQFQNPKTGLWTKRDTETGRFLNVKTSSPKKFKGIKKEK